MTTTAGFGQQEPAEAQTLRELTELIGARLAEGIWELMVRELRLTRPVIGSAELRRIAEEAMRVGDLLRVTGRSAKVRTITYDALTRSVEP